MAEGGEPEEKRSEYLSSLYGELSKDNFPEKKYVFAGFLNIKSDHGITEIKSHSRT